MLESAPNDSHVLEWLQAAQKGRHNHGCVLLCQSGAVTEWALLLSCLQHTLGGGDTLTPPNNAYPLLPISPGLCFLDEVEEAS